MYKTVTLATPPRWGGEPAEQARRWRAWGDDAHIPRGMSNVLPGSREFQTPVYGTVFGKRTEVLHRLRQGDALILVPDPPGTEDPSVWVHAVGGDVVGHLSPDVSSWLVPWMLQGGRCGGIVARIGSDDIASYKRLVITVRCRDDFPRA